MATYYVLVGISLRYGGIDGAFDAALSLPELGHNE